MTTILIFWLAPQRKKISYEITVFIFKVFKKFKSIQVKKHLFFFISETDVKMVKETQRRRTATRRSNKTFKKVAKAEIDLN